MPLLQVGGPGNTDNTPLRMTGEQVGGRGADGNFHIFSTDNQGVLNVNTGGGVGAISENLTQVGSTNITLGQKTMALSLPVVIASDQSSIPVTGTVTVLQGTSPWVVSGTVTANIGAGGLGTVGSPIRIDPTGTTVQPVSGTVAISGTPPFNLTQWASTVLGTPTNFGTTPGAVIAGSVNASLFSGTTALTNTGGALNVTVASTTITGTVAVTQSTSPWVVSLASTTVTNTVAENLIQVAGVTLGATAVTNFGTAPAAAVVPGVNASLFAGTTALTSTAGALNVTLASTTITGTSAFNLTQWASTVLGVPTAFGTTPGAVVVGSVNASLFIGTVAAVASSAGVQKVGISGATGATLDAVITAVTAPANGLATLVEYVSTAPALTTGQSVMTQANSAGDLFVKPFRRSEVSSQATTIASSVVQTNILPVGAAGVFVDLSSLVITVLALANAAAPIPFTVSLKDGTNTYIYDMMAHQIGTTTIISNISAGLNLSFNPPLPGATAATQWSATLSVTGVTVHITAIGVKQTAS